MGAQPQHEEFPKSQFPKFLLSFSLLALKSWQLSLLRSPLRAAKIWDVISLKLSLLPTPFCSHLFSKGFSKGATAPPWNQRIFGIFGIFGILESGNSRGVRGGRDTFHYARIFLGHFQGFGIPHPTRDPVRNVLVWDAASPFFLLEIPA